MIDVVNGQPKRCLAISGGGIRAGSVSLGFLQELERTETLATIDILATVSGGGYPVYGILDQHTRYQTDLKTLLSEDGDFIKSIDNNASFISDNDFKAAIASSVYEAPWWMFWRQIISGDLPKPSALTRFYKAEIKETFSDSPSAFSDSPLRDVKVPAGFPYPIFLVSANIGTTAPEKLHIYKAIDQLELSPNLIGSKRFGYWNRFSEYFDLIDAISASASAIDTPEDETFDEIIPDFAKSMGFSVGITFPLPDGQTVYLSDGGFIENQSILPLAERKCQQIIALDVTSDPSGSFKTWDITKKRLLEVGMTLQKPIVPMNQATPFNNDTTSGWQLPSHLFSSSIETPDGEILELIIVKLGLAVNDLKSERYPMVVQDFIQNLNLDLSDGIHCNDEVKFDSRCAFPLESVVRQSYTKCEFQAYRHLGKYLAQQLTTELNEVSPH